MTARPMLQNNNSSDYLGHNSDRETPPPFLTPGSNKLNNSMIKSIYWEQENSMMALVNQPKNTITGINHNRNFSDQ